MVAVLLAAPLGACAVSRSPGDIRQQTQARQFHFAQGIAATKICLLPKLDSLQPFTLDPSTRPPSVREMGTKVEIFAQDETITVYAVDLEPAPRGSMSSVFAKTSELSEKLAQVMQQCGGS